MTPLVPPRRSTPRPDTWRTPLLALVLATPVLALTHLAFFALLATLQSGLWPLTPVIDPKDVSFPGHSVFVFLLLMAAVTSPVPLIMATLALASDLRPATRWGGAFLFAAGYALFWIVIRTDPWGTVTWLGD